ncbi:hypothetical protein LUZ60_009592 [Juncus effusus]|nr:hypothetical protein LUZ60_009592 [Juncus effusus]
MDRDGGNLLTTIGFTMLTCNSALAIYRSKEDSSSITFIVITYIALLLLFFCLRMYEREERNPDRREKLKACVWLLSTLITVMFAYKVAALMPFWVAMIVWGMASSVVIGGFYVFFIYRD